MATGFVGVTFDLYQISECGPTSSIAANCTVYIRGWERVATAADAP